MRQFRLFGLFWKQFDLAIHRKEVRNSLKDTVERPSKLPFCGIFQIQAKAFLLAAQQISNIPTFLCRCRLLPELMLQGFFDLRRAICSLGRKGMRPCFPYRKRAVKNSAKTEEANRKILVKWHDNSRKGTLMLPLLSILVLRYSTVI